MTDVRVATTVMFCLAVAAAAQGLSELDAYGARPPVVACFLESWALYRPSLGRFRVEYINSTLCTHVVYCYAGLDASTNKIEHSDVTLFKRGVYRQLVDLKESNPNLKVTIAIGGWATSLRKYSRMVGSAETREVFVSSVVAFLQQHSFDGLVWDWRDPGTKGGTNQDKGNFLLLCKELRAAFDHHDWHLGVATSAHRNRLDLGYDLPGLAQFADLLYVLSYDYHGSWDGATGHGAPLYPSREETFGQRQQNVNFTVEYILSQGVPSNKLVLGIQFYGRSYLLENTSNTGLGAPIKNDAFKGPYTRAKGILGYNEICEMLLADGARWSTHWEDHQKVPYVVKGDRWIGYESPRSLGEKMDLVESRGLGGVSVLSVASDDFLGTCGAGKYPLLTAVHRRIEAAVEGRPKGLPLRVPLDPAAPIVSCFLESWAERRASWGHFSIEDLDTSLCTHIVYCYAGLDGHTLDTTELDRVPEAYEHLLSLRHDHPSLVLTVAVGGWDAGSVVFSTMAATRESRRTFIASVVAFLRRTGLDGIDLVWRDPASRGGAPKDKENYALLCRELRRAFSPRGWHLGVAVSGRKVEIELGYDLQAIATAADVMYVLAYMFTRRRGGQTRHPAPLYPREGEEQQYMDYNVNFTVSYLLSKGVPPHKMVLGLHFFGRTFVLKQRSNAGLGAPVYIRGFKGPYTLTNGIIGYNEVCELLNTEQSGWALHWDPQQRAPYMVKGNQWVGYDNSTSIREKVELAVKRNLKGAMVWAVSTDDFRGRCGAGRYPLLLEVNRAMGRIIPTPHPLDTVPVMVSLGSGCSMTSIGGVTVDVLLCGQHYDVPVFQRTQSMPYCIFNNKVPASTEVLANCWDTVTLVMRCHEDGYWRRYNGNNSVEDAARDRLSDGGKMRHLCQPFYLNSEVCGHRPRYEHTGSTKLNLEAFYIPKNSWPWAAGLLRNDKYICGATVISPVFLVTAAHCVTSSLESSTASIDVRDLKVYLAGYTLKRVVAIHLYPDYQAGRRPRNDIAVIKLEHPLRFGSKMGPACVNFGEGVPNVPALTFNHSDISHFRHNDFVIQQLDPRCEDPWDRCFRPQAVAPSASQFCSVSSESRSSLSVGSSGGSFLQDLSQHDEGEDLWTVSGVVSFSEGVACNTTVYTAIHAFQGWIVSVVHDI